MTILGPLSIFEKTSQLYDYKHELWTPGEEIAFTARPKNQLPLSNI